jgi:hypothetical protein
MSFAMEVAIGKRLVTLLKSGAIDFAEKNCNLGLSCGDSCISKLKVCVKLLTPEQKAQYKALLKSAKSGDGAAVIAIDKIRFDQQAPKPKDKTPEGLWLEPKTHQQFIENGKTVLGAELFDRITTSKQTLADLEQQEIDYKGDRDIRYLPRKQDNRLADPEYTAIDSKYNVTSERFSELKRIMLNSPKETIDALTPQFLKLEADFYEQQASLLAKRSQLDQQFDEAETPLRQMQQRRSLVLNSGQDAIDKLIKSSAIDAAAAAELVNKVKLPRGNPQLKADLARLAQITEGHGFESLKEIKHQRGRAFADRSGLLVKQKNADLRILAHELGHHVEFESDDVLQASKDWVKSRATGPEQSMRSLTGNKRYDSSEKALPDKFIHPYVGKGYNAASEVVSMGTEYFDSPKRLMELASTDPEHFAYTVGVIRRPKRGNKTR